MKSKPVTAPLVATALAALWVLSLSSVADATMITPRPIVSMNYGDSKVGESAIAGHFQQIYPGSSFYVTETIEIQQIRLRPHDEGSFSISLSDVELSLSTTDTRPLAISGQFAENAGSEATQVYSGALELRSHGTSGQPGRDFDIVIDLDEPFYYNPDDGNLLLEWNNRGSVETHGAAANFDYVGRRFGTAASLLGDSESGVAEVGGLATRFSDGVIPEPTGALLFSIAALMTLAPRRRE